jgi:citrate lyase subunit beta/citryl-CoA lyase
MIRSWLYVPAIAPRFVAKAAERGADAIILDLEDSVAEAEKDAARAALADAVPTVRKGGATIMVRVNSEPERHRQDVEAACRAGADGVLLAKTRDPAALRDLAEWLAPIEASLGRAALRFVPVLEDPASVFEARPIALATPRNMALITGGEDLATAMGAEPSPDLLRLPKQLVNLAAKSAGLLSIGLMRSVANFQDVEGITASAMEARALGFDGATCIHPNVVPILNAAFSPSEAELEAARRMVLAYEAQAARGVGAFTLDGKMVDLPIVDRARRLLARAK